MSVGRRTPTLWAAALLLVVLWGTGPAEASGAVAQTRPQADQQAPEVFSEEISVSLLTVAVRVVDSHGDPVPDLAPADLHVRYRRQVLPVVAVEWVSGATSDPAALSVGPTSGRVRAIPAPPPPTVFWVQADFNAVRIKGHLRLLPHLRQLLADLPLGGRMAVFSFDSHLKLWQDFTDDRELVETALERSVRFGNRPPPPRSARHGLGRHLDPVAARRAATPEVGLRVTAEALQAFPGEKVLVLVGWGLGRYGSSGFRMTPEYPRTLRALAAARTTVFVLDVTDADYHTLEIGIEALARNTGGTYAKTNLFASQATKRLARSLSGFYRVTVDRSEARDAQPGDLRFRLVGREGRVLARGR